MKKEKTFESLLKEAPNHFTVESLCDSLQLPLPTYYRWTENRLDIRESVNNALAKRFELRKQETEDGSIVTITITYKEAQQDKNHRFTLEERERFVDIISYAYEMGVSVHEACKKLGIHQSTFFKWIDPNSPLFFKYAQDRYTLAKNTRAAIHNEELAFQARVALGGKLRERKVVNTTNIYEIKGGDETPVLKEKREVERTFMPEMAAVALTLNNLDNDFRKATAGGQLIQDDADLQAMTEDEIKALLEAEIERNKALRGGGGNTDGDSTH